MASPLLRTSAPWWASRRNLGYGFLIVFFLVVFFNARQYGHVHTGDSDNLVKGARVAVDCIRDRQFVECGYLKGSIQTLVFPYPLLQYLPASLLVWLQVLRCLDAQWLAFINLLAVVAMLIAIVTVFRARPRLAALLVVSLVGSSLLYQSTSAFGEALAASLVVGAVLAGIRRSPLAIFVLVTLGSLGKETLAPFVVLLVLACARTPRGWSISRKEAHGGGGRRWRCRVDSQRAHSTCSDSARSGICLYLDPPQHTPGFHENLSSLLPCSHPRRRESSGSGHSSA